MPRGPGRQAARAENLSRDLKPTGELLGELHINAKFLISRWQHCRVGRSQSVHRQRLACVAMRCQTPSTKLKLLAPHARRRKCCAHRNTTFAPAVTRACRRGPTHGPECIARAEGRRVALLHGSATGCPAAWGLPARVFPSHSLGWQRACSGSIPSQVCIDHQACHSSIMTWQLSWKTSGESGKQAELRNRPDCAATVWRGALVRSAHQHERALDARPQDEGP